VAFTTGEASNRISVPAKLVRRGNELRMAVSPDGKGQSNQSGNPTLVRLVAQGFAAREHVVNGRDVGQVSTYDSKHLQKLIRVSWLAPDIIAAILDGRHPAQLTARHLLRCADIPMDWQQQRSFLGFSQALS
jgi:site-specific DNA recombinase